MHRAFSFPVTVERSRTKDRLEASLAGLCDLELRKQRQECLVLAALALGDPLVPDSDRDDAGCFSSWGKDNLTLRRQLRALQSSPWGLMQVLEQQVGELRIDNDEGGFDGTQVDTRDSQPSSGLYELNEGESPKGRTSSTELTEAVSSWVHTSRPKSIGDPLNSERDMPIQPTTIPRSFSFPYPPLENTAVDSWQWDQVCQQQQPAEDQITEENYQFSVRVEGYIFSLIQRYTLASRSCQPRTTLSPEPPHCSALGHSSIHRRTPCMITEELLLDPILQPQADLSANPTKQCWACDLLEGEACGGEAPSLKEDCYLALPYPQPRPHSLTERLPSPLPSLVPNCSVGALDRCYEPPSPQHYLDPQPQTILHKQNLEIPHHIPGQTCHNPMHFPRNYHPEYPKLIQTPTSPVHANSKPRTAKKNQNERPRAKKSSSKTSRSQSENSLLGYRILPERRYSTTERHQNHSQVTGPQLAVSNQNGSRRWCSNLELSQDEGETLTGRVHRRPPRKARHGYPSHSQLQNYCHQRHHQRRHPHFQDRAPLCQEEDGCVVTIPGESESSMSEVYSPASSSLSSDSDEGGGMVWPEQLPPRFTSASSSSSPSPQTTTNAPTHPKAFVKIKASHALKKKILRFRSGSLKVMTTV